MLLVVFGGLKVTMGDMRPKQTVEQTKKTKEIISTYQPDTLAGLNSESSLFSYPIRSFCEFLPLAQALLRNSVFPLRVRQQNYWARSIGSN